VLVALMVAGALIRHFFVARHAAKRLGRRPPWGAVLAGCAMLVALAAWLAPAPPSSAGAGAAVPSMAQVQSVITQRCVMCHNEQVQNKSVALHTEALVRQHAQAVYQQAVLLRQMPLNNATGITDDERALIRRWFEAGAP
jgi:uncharacterized membrane protein